MTRRHMGKIKTKLGYGGGLVIPAPYRKALGLKPGDEVVLALEEGELRGVTVPGGLALSPGRGPAED